MTSPHDERQPSGSRGNVGRSIGRVIGIALALIAAAIITPLAITGKAIHDLWADDRTRNLVTAAAWLLIAGTIVFMILEDLTLVDGFYFSFITLSTIGYGDISPVTELGKIFAVLYGIAGLGILASLISAIARRPLSRRRGRGSSSAETATG